MIERYKNVKWEDVQPNLQKAFEAMVAGGKGIYLYGSVGTGKTHIAYAMKKHYDWPSEETPSGYRLGRNLQIHNMIDLMHEIRSDFDRTIKENPDDRITEYTGVMILDDFGAEKATDFVAETIYRLINHRYERMLPTMFTSNCTLQELAEKLGERTTSRIVEMCDVYNLAGGDRRLQK
ncbi:MAG: ATP-binding protein [Patescibacteria group bacterium]|nr:ATP-binding protein [Patescibacteria group bacterium]